MGWLREPFGFDMRPPCLYNVSRPHTVRDMEALIVYHTNTGHTKRAAEDIAEGLRAEGVDARLQSANEMTKWDVADEQIIVVGSPCHAGSVAIRAGLSGPVRSALRRLAASSLVGKVGGAFSVNCAYGGHRTVRAIEKHLRAAGARVAEPGVVVKAGVPFSLVKGPLASEEAREQLREFGRALARAADDGR